MLEKFRRRRLPHLDLPGATYFITTCLAGSIPARGLLEIRTFQERLVAGRPQDRSPEWKELIWKKTFVEQEKWLDGEPAVRHLERPELARIVASSLCHFHHVRYELLAYAIMPSHIHWLFRPFAEWATTLDASKSAREVIMHCVKSFTAHQCNKLLQQSGSFWQDESFDHCVKDDDELERIVNYIELNPVKAGLCKHREEWQWSSASQVSVETARQEQ